MHFSLQITNLFWFCRGEPANVSKDWLREARVLLETKQACRALVAYAASVGVEAMPQRKKEDKAVAAAAEAMSDRQD